MKITLPAYQHPTLVVVVDDSASFLESLKFQMKPSITLKSFCDPYAAIQWLKQSADINVGHDNLPGVEHPGAMGAEWIERIVADPQRFGTNAVVVVDYAMPTLDGLDFCRALAGLACKKILLTGAANEMVAVEAFNQGLIDRYLKKQNPGVLDRLELEIEQLQQEYFIEKSDLFQDYLVKPSFSFLSDPVFARLARSLAQRHGFVEHFIFSEPMGLLFFDADGKPTLMVVETKAGFAAHLDIAQEYGAPAELKTALNEQKVVPFFWKSGGMFTEKSNDWQQYCLPAQVCAGREEYFWALFDLPEKFFNRAVFPYKKYLRDSRE